MPQALAYARRFFFFFLGVGGGAIDALVVMWQNRQARLGRLPRAAVYGRPAIDNRGRRISRALPFSCGLEE